MNKTASIVAITLLAGSAAAAFADPIPYNMIGTPIASTTFTATATGTIDAYYINGSSAHSDEIQACDVNSGLCSNFTFRNNYNGTVSPTVTTTGTPYAGTYATTPTVSTTGAEATLLSVTAGDSIIFFLEDFNTGVLQSSDSAYSADGYSHTYKTPASAGELYAGSPAGTYVGFEDLPAPGEPSDYDYNDDTYIITNVGAATPEPSSLVLLGTGILGLAGAARRRLGRS